MEDCYGSGPWADADECMAWLAAALASQIEQIVDHILSIRPDIRIAMLSYDYAAREPDAGYTTEEQHLAFVNIQEAIRGMTLSKDRVEWVNNFGLMQYLYGIPEADPPIDPGVVPPPCISPTEPSCTEWPGGDPAHLSPLFTYIDQGHPSYRLWVSGCCKPVP